MVQYLIRRLRSEDWESFREIRRHMFSTQPREFRTALEDEEKLTQEEIRSRLAIDHVVGAVKSNDLLGVAGITRNVGEKLKHKGLLWGMYVKQDFRGTGIADALMKHLVDCHLNVIETITLTVVSHNERAVKFYERWGFKVFGTEPGSLKTSEGDYLNEHLMFLNLGRYK